jgi:hypothetical protein
MKLRLASIGLALLLASHALSASGPVGFYALIDKVVFEPSEAAAERLQVWGSFAYLEGAGLRRDPAAGGGISAARRGYLYFRVSEIAGEQRTVVRREWADLKAAAGTGQAVGFGRWVYIGGFGDLRPDAASQSGIYAPTGGARVDLRVRPASEPVANPIDYLTNAGVVKITESSHAAVLKALREAK